MDEQRRLPQPATNADEYLYDIAMSLRTITQRLAVLNVLVHRIPQTPVVPEPVEGTEGEEVELKEPVPPKRKHRG
jgi:hypothetical protein